MQAAPIPDDEAKRLALLEACRIMYTPAEQAFDDVARLAADLCGTEIALITLVGEDRQWFKARVGVEQTELARDLSFCGHCINHTQAMVVRDTLLDPRFADNPLVTGDPHLRFYAGVPLLVEPGSAVGAISVADREPRDLTPRQLDSLRRLAEQIARELRLRRDMARTTATTLRSGPRFTMAPGAILDGRWQLERELGRGSGGAVYLAQDARGHRVAVKMLLPEWRTHENILARFVREARVLMALTTPHVAKLIDVGNLEPDDGDLPYLVLEYLDGQDLSRVLQLHGRLPYRQVFEWCADACDGVAEAHAVGVVHRDLKPSNVFLTRTPESEAFVKVIDFGIAIGEPDEARPQHLTHAGQILGTPGYMSPEQMSASHDIDGRGDVWSMGVMLYELVTGRMPFAGASPLEIFANTMTRPPLPLAAYVKEPLPPGVAEVIFACLRKSREDRIPTMSALASALRAVARA